MANPETALPKDLKWRIHVGLAVIFVILIFTVGIATAMHLADNQFISSDELDQNLKQLQSYTAEAKIISRQYYIQSAPRAYVEAYGSALQESVNSISEKLDEHPHADALDDKVSQAIDLANQLSDHLQTLSTEPRTQLPPQSETNQFFQQLSDELQNLEEGL